MDTATATQTNERARYLCQLVFWAVFWVWGTYGFLADDVFRALQHARSALMWALDAAMVLMACAVVRNRWTIMAMGAFAACAWGITCYVNHESTLFWINGMREFIGLIMVYPVMLFIMGTEQSRERFLDSFDRQGLYFLLVQAFCILVQLFEHGAGDLVGGGFGHYFSGQVSVTIYLISFFLLRRRIDNQHFLYSLGQNKVYILLLLPTFLNETKVSFVMLALYFLLLVPIDRKLLLRMVVVVPLVALAMWAGVFLYTYTTSLSQSGIYFSSVEDVVAYFVLDDLDSVEGDARWNMENNRGITDVPRFTKLAYLAVLNEQEPGHMAVGFGVGQFKGGTQIATSEFARTYDWLLMGSVPYVFHIYIQLGIVGLLSLLLYFTFLALWRPQWATGRDVNLQLMLLMVVLLVLFYNDMLRNLAFCMLFFTLMAASWKRSLAPDPGPKEKGVPFYSSHGSPSPHGEGIGGEAPQLTTRN